MRPGDIARGLALCRTSGWNQMQADWEQLLALGAGGCFVAEVDGRVVGTVTVVAYERRFAWIGMVLVEPGMRGRGIGGALMDRALGALGDLPARLDATPQGYPMYRRLGFVEESRFCRMTRAASGEVPGQEGPQAAAPCVRPMAAPDRATIRQWDRAVFGADRADLLEWASRTEPRLAWIASTPAGMRGYCLGRRGHSWLQVGPIVACDVAAGSALVAACVDALPGAPLVLDAAIEAPGWTAELSALGFVEQRPFVRMCRGTNRHVGRREQQLAIFGPEWG
jgi:GNAT superfamily N-acetyltransferase